MYSHNPNIVVRKIHDTIFLIDITDTYFDDNCSLYEINEIGLYIWNNLLKFNDIESLAYSLKSVIIDDIDIKVLYSDIEEFINSLYFNGFIKER